MRELNSSKLHILGNLQSLRSNKNEFKKYKSYVIGSLREQH